MGAFEVFAIVASAIALVFLSWALFRMTKFPPGTLFILLGVGLSLVGTTMPSSLIEAVDLATPILLGSVLFSCGLKINLHGLVKHRGAVSLSILTLALTGLITGSAGYFMLGLGLIGSALLAAICASICSFFVFHIMDAVNLDERVENALMLESSLTEALAVLAALAVFRLSEGGPAVQSLAFGLVFGLLAGIVWVRLIRFISDFPHRDALTLSVVLGVAAFCEMAFQNSGMASAFFFGLAMGNAGLLKSKARFEGLLRFQEDVLMAGGTFFFFYVGLSARSADLSLALAGGALWVFVLAIRAFSTRVSIPACGGALWAVAGLGPKGLSAVLIWRIALDGGFAGAGTLFSLAVPIVVLSGLFAGLSASRLVGKRPPRVESVTASRAWDSERPKESGAIRHAYDMDELKRTINGEES